MLCGVNGNNGKRAYFWIAIPLSEDEKQQLDSLTRGQGRTYTKGQLMRESFLFFIKHLPLKLRRRSK